jgi:hypothetical protein
MKTELTLANHEAVAHAHHAELAPRSVRREGLREKFRDPAPATAA